MLKKAIKIILEKIKKYWLVLLFIILLIIKILIVQVQPTTAKYSMIYDDQLMVEQANSIVSGNWLGEYNSKTLTKGVFTPLFIALTYILNIPFLIGKEIFYGIACIVFVLIISKKIKSKIALICIYIIILINPVEYSVQLCRVYRDGLYTSLILFLLAFLIGIFINRKKGIKKQIKYFIGLGISFGATYLCREETIWLLPVILIMSIATIIPNYLNKKIFLYIIPIVITLLLTNVVCMINYKYYGVYTLNQYWGKAFQSAYGALLRIKPQEEKQRVPITRETMQRLYEVSPKFAELKVFLEGQEGDDWRDIGITIDGEMTGGYVQWALMDAVESLGYYETATKAEKYYTELAEEINKLCDEGVIESRTQKIVSNSCYFELGDILKTITKMPETIKYQYTLEDISMMVINPGEIIGLEKEKILFEKMTNQPIVTMGHYTQKTNRTKIMILEKVEKIYENINPYLFYISIIVVVIFVLINIKKLKEVYEELVILIAIAGLYASRIFIITFTKEMMFEEALNTSYLACIYDIQYLFGIISIIFLVTNIKNRNKNKVNKDESYYRKIFSNLKDWVNRKKGEKI